MRGSLHSAPVEMTAFGVVAKMPPRVASFGTVDGARGKTNAGVSPLRSAPVEMTAFGVVAKMPPRVASFRTVDGARGKTNAGVSPLRSAPVEMTSFCRHVLQRFAAAFRVAGRVLPCLRDR
jgi:hypothetical protein